MRESRQRRLIAAIGSARGEAFGGGREFAIGELLAAPKANGSGDRLEDGWYSVMQGMPVA
jgi:hypothetical protein